MSEKDKPRKSHMIRNIAIALIVLLAAFLGAVIVADIEFTCYGCGFTSSAQIQVSPISCTGIANTTCSAELVNTGTADTNVVSGSITFGGKSVIGTCQQLTLRAGTTTKVGCIFLAPPGVPVEAFTGSIGTSNGGQALFSGVFIPDSGGYTSTTYSTSWTGAMTTMTTTVTMTTTITYLTSDTLP